MALLALKVAIKVVASREAACHKLLVMVSHRLSFFLLFIVVCSDGDNV